MKRVLRIGAMVAALSYCALAQAQVLIIKLTGTATLQAGTAPAVAVTQDLKEVPVGALLKTGSASTMVLGFPDGQVCVLGENSTFRVNAYRFAKGRADQGFVDLSLGGGSLRIAFGEIGTANPSAIRVQMGAANLGLGNAEAAAPTDASVVVLGGPALVVVQSGYAVVSLPSGQGQEVRTGEGMFLAQDGTVRRGDASNMAALVGDGPSGREMLRLLTTLQAATQTILQTVITLATVFGQAPEDVLTAPATNATTTAGTAGLGGGGGGNIASPN